MIEEDVDNPLIDEYISECFYCWAKLTFDPPTYHLSPGEPSPPPSQHELMATAPHFDPDLQALIEAETAIKRQIILGVGMQPLWRRPQG